LLVIVFIVGARSILSLLQSLCFFIAVGLTIEVCRFHSDSIKHDLHGQVCAESQYFYKTITWQAMVKK